MQEIDKLKVSICAYSRTGVHASLLSAPRSGTELEFWLSALGYVVRVISMSGMVVGRR